jgi:hypothetical protein
MVIITVNFGQNYNLTRVKVKITTLLLHMSIQQNIWKVVFYYYIDILTYKVTILKNICNPTHKSKLKKKHIIYIYNQNKIKQNN